MKKQMLVLALATTLGTAQAANHQYILLHGFQPSQLQSQPDAAAVTANGEKYWQEFWLQHARAGSTGLLTNGSKAKLPPIICGRSYNNCRGTTFVPPAVC